MLLCVDQRRITSLVDARGTGEVREMRQERVRSRARDGRESKTRRKSRSRSESQRERDRTRDAITRACRRERQHSWHYSRVLKYIDAKLKL